MTVDQKPQLWLTMSGGGFRAALYHFGCLKRLHELGLLSQVYGISATSGGAFTASLWATSGMRAEKDDDSHYYPNWDAFEREFLTIVMRGVLLPTTLLVFAYGCYIASLVALIIAYGCYIAALSSPTAVLITAGILFACAGVIVHSILALYLIREKTYRELIREKLYREMEGNRPTSNKARLLSPGVKRFLSMLFFPSQIRWQTLNLRVFGAIRLGALSLVPVKVYLTAVELNSGEEQVFSAEVVADLSRTGCRDLWRQRIDGHLTNSWKARDIPLALAVAASTAFPPWFKPIHVTVGEQHLGSYVDGGVADNVATKVPRNFALHLDSFKNVGNIPDTFKDRVGYLLALDASAPTVKAKRARWTRWRSLLRLVQVLQNEQFDILMTVVASFKRLAGIDGEALGLQVGFGISDNDLTELGDELKNVRTNLDSFSIHECAAIAYCGYYHVNYWFENRPGLRDMFETRDAPFLKFPEFLLPEFRTYHTSVEDLRRHLRFSGLTFSIRRAMARLL
jgi:predicted acylesterase/phospholipase RssA